MAQSQEVESADPVTAVLDAHGGDVRAAVTGLLNDIEYLRNQIAFASLVTSRGYAYGWVPSFERTAEE